MRPHSSAQVIGVVLVVVLAGCGGLGGLMGGGDLTFTASKISVADSTVTDAGFKIVTEKEVTFERSVEVQGQSKKVVMNAYMIHLQRSYEGAPLGNVVILSLPQVKVLGQSINIANQLNPADLISQAQGQTGNLKQQQKIRERSVRILGQQRTVEVFRGTAEQNGQSAKVKIYITTFGHGDDTIVGVGIIPQAANDEQSALAAFQAIQAG